MTAIPLVRANHANAHDAALLIATAFDTLPVCEWLVPELADRRPVLHRHFRIWVDHAIAHGEVWLTDDRTGVAVWFPRDPQTPVPEIDQYDQRLTAACGEYIDRFRTLDAVLDKHHPHDTAHHHLAFLAVDPAHQSNGIGSALLDHQLARLDQAGMPAYLEASSVDSRRLYLRNGFVDYGPPITLPGTRALFWPMWREAHTGPKSSPDTENESPDTAARHSEAPGSADPDNRPGDVSPGEGDRVEPGRVLSMLAARWRRAILAYQPNRIGQVIAERRLVETIRARLAHAGDADDLIRAGPSAR